MLGLYKVETVHYHDNGRFQGQEHYSEPQLTKAAPFGNGRTRVILFFYSMQDISKISLTKNASILKIKLSSLL